MKERSKNLNYNSVFRLWKYWEGGKDAIKDVLEAVDFQTDFVKDLAK